MSDVQHIKNALRTRIEELAPYLFPRGRREGVHWCVGDVSGAPGKSFKICLSGEKAGFWGDFNGPGKHSRYLIDLWMQARNVDFKTALREAAEWTGYDSGNGKGPIPSKPTSAPTFRTLDEAVGITENRLKMRAARRDWYRDCNGNERFVVVRFDSDNDKDFRPFHEGEAGWVVSDSPGKLPLFQLPDLIARPRDPVIIVEGERCACDLATIGVLVTTSAHGAKSADKTDWTPLAGREVVILPDNDVTGRAYAKIISGILAQLSPPGVVRIVELPDLPQKGDCVDWLEARDAQTPEDIRAELLRLIDRAEVIHPSNATPAEKPECSWADALVRSVVTSRELQNLVLVPRKKLLGDWFCEGDLGFIFAFRGVGKTWLALAIAQALSTGGKLGHWPAWEPVNVLYVDGEMPPDLMRVRCKGLQATNENLRFLNHEILFERAGRVLNIARPEDQQAITARCVADGVKVLILDNLSTVASGVRENEADSWEQVNQWLLDLRRRKIAVLIIHHAGRSGEMRGTSKREDNVFWIIALDDAKQNADDKRGARFISRFTKRSRNTQDEIPAYEWHIVTNPVTGEISVGCKMAQSMDVFRRLIEDGVTECSELAEEMKVSKGTISKWATRANREGWLNKKGREYKLADGTKSRVGHGGNNDGKNGNEKG
jgi:hypothetical protein